jgi:hypothetical protein
MNTSAVCRFELPNTKAPPAEPEPEDAGRLRVIPTGLTSDSGDCGCQGTGVDRSCVVGARVVAWLAEVSG